MKIKIQQSSHPLDLKQSILEYYQITEKNYQDMISTCELSDPYECEGMETCIEILRHIKQNNEKILICGDYDCDGICATTILCKAFDEVGIQYGFYIPNRLTEGYGLQASTVRLGVSKGYRYFITVDNGVKAFDAIETIQELGAHLILTDHHSYEQIPPCDVFIHPFTMSEKFQGLCGAGVALQIARCLIPHNKEIVCLAAIATIADCMKVTHENRAIIQLGIQYLNEGCCPPIHALKSTPQTILDQQSIAFQIVPKINTTGRLADLAVANNTVRYLLAKDSNLILDGARQITKINDLRKTKTGEMEKVARSYLDDHFFQVIAHDTFHEGIVGLVASRLSNVQSKPVMVLAENENDYKGSIRSVEGLNLLDFFRDFPKFKTFGGHAQAAGISIEKKDLEELKQYIYEKEGNIELVEAECTVLQVNEEACDIQSVLEYQKLSPFGYGFEEIVFYFDQVQIANVQSLSNGKHMKINSTSGIEYLFFNQKDLFESFQSKKIMNVYGKLRVSEFRGFCKVSVIVEGIEEKRVS